MIHSVGGIGIASSHHRELLKLLVASSLVLAVVFISLVALLFTTYDYWTQELMGNPLGSQGVIALDSEGGVHVAYVGYESYYPNYEINPRYLEYAYNDPDNNSSQWSTEQLAYLGPNSPPIELAIDSHRDAHVCTFYHIVDSVGAPTGNCTLTYAEHRSDGWAVSNITVPLDIDGLRITIAPDDTARIVALAGEPYFWSIWDPEVWSLVEYIPGTPGWSPTTILIFPNGTESRLFCVEAGEDGTLCVLTSTASLVGDYPVCSYLNLTTYTGGSRTQSVVAFRDGTWRAWNDFASMDIDSEGKAHVCYYDIDLGRDSSLVYANNSGGEWTRLLIGWTGISSYGHAIHVDPHGAVNVVYYAQGRDSSGRVTNYTVRLATMASPEWEVVVVADRMGSSPEHVGYDLVGGDSASIGVDSSGDVHIVYQWLDTGWNPDDPDSIHVDRYVCYCTNAEDGKLAFVTQRAALYLVPFATVVAFANGYSLRQKLSLRMKDGYAPEGRFERYLAWTLNTELALVIGMLTIFGIAIIDIAVGAYQTVAWFPQEEADPLAILAALPVAPFLGIAALWGCWLSYQRRRFALAVFLSILGVTAAFFLFSYVALMVGVAGIILVVFARNEFSD